MSDYPHEADLKRIREWDGDLRAAFAFIRSIWWAPDWGWHEDTEPDDTVADEDAVVTCYRISTGGWSGNEEIIEAMQQNFLLWSMTWMQTRRGGHYIFELREDANADTADAARS